MGASVAMMGASRTRRRRVAGLAVATAVALLGTACRSGDPSGSPAGPTTTTKTDAAATLTRAADLTIEAGTGHVEVATDLLSGTGADPTLKGKVRTAATYDRGGDTFEQTTEIAFVVRLEYTTVSDGTTTWFRSSELDDRLAPGTWVRQDVADLRAEDEDVATLVRPTDVLDLLRGTPPAAADEGTLDIDGVATRRLHVVTTIERLGGALPADRKLRLARAIGGMAASDDPSTVLDAGISAMVHVLPDGRVRRLDLTIEVHPATHDGYHSIYDFTELGAPVTIAVPPAGAVVEARDVPKER